MNKFLITYINQLKIFQNTIQSLFLYFLVSYSNHQDLINKSRITMIILYQYWFLFISTDSFTHSNAEWFFHFYFYLSKIICLFLFFFFISIIIFIFYSFWKAREIEQDYKSTAQIYYYYYFVTYCSRFIWQKIFTDLLLLTLFML